MKQATCTHQDIQTECPSCGKNSIFQHIGEQKWSEAVARKLGVPTIINLYNCGACKSTITGIQLTR